ncbi:hypothetical protein [Tateyamaria sp. SN3-11]|uniref:hypothetical protein n=1 Tax=Tateyamaria sp. SN3-11 TaxID=3092147 RepID=UPI0039E9A61C
MRSFFFAGALFLTAHPAVAQGQDTQLDANIIGSPDFKTTGAEIQRFFEITPNQPNSPAVIESQPWVRQLEAYQQGVDALNSGQEINAEALWRNIAEEAQSSNDTSTVMDQLLLDGARQSSTDPNSILFLPQFQAEFEPPVSVTIDDVKTAQEIQELAPKVLLDGAVFGKDFLADKVDQQTLDQWWRNSSQPIDLEQLGLSQPSASLDTYLLSDDGFTVNGIITQPSGVPLSAEQKARLANSKTWRKSLSRWGETIYSSVQDAFAVTVETVCKSAFKPKNFSVELSGSGNLLLAELGVSISAEFETDSVCVPFS